MGQRWDYGDEGRAFDVQVGETWRVGEHLFHCSDLMAHRTFDDVVRRFGPGPKLLYSDPPWGQSLVNSFRTKAGLQKAEYRWEDLYRRIASIGHQYGIPIWVEASKVEHRDGRKVPETLVGPGYNVTDYAEIAYYRTNPSGLYYAGKMPPPLRMSSLSGMDDEVTPAMVMQGYGPSGLVLDPCAGRGVTSRRADDVGWRSINNELNPNRVSASLVRMSKQINENPERVA